MACPIPSSPHASSLAPSGLVALPTSSPPQPERQRHHRVVTPLDRPAVGLELDCQPCSSCGGSGMLRLNVQSHRTCMDCLGGGERLLTSADLLRRAGIRAVVSSSGAG